MAVAVPAAVPQAQLYNANCDVYAEWIEIGKVLGGNNQGVNEKWENDNCSLSFITEKALWIKHNEFFLTYLSIPI